MGTCNHSINDPLEHPEYDLAFIVRENHGNTWIPKGAGNFSGYEMTHGVNINNDSSWLKVGVTTCIEGRGGHTWGEILKASTTIYFSDVTLRDRVTYNNESWPGQSGGAVWTYVPEKGHGKRIVAIHNGGTGTYSYGTNVKYVKKVYGGGQLYTE